MSTPEILIGGKNLPGSPYYQGTTEGSPTGQPTMNYGGNFNPMMAIMSLFSGMGGMGGGFGGMMQNPWLWNLMRQMGGGRGRGFKQLGQQGFNPRQGFQLPNMGMGLGNQMGGIPGAPPMVDAGNTGSQFGFGPQVGQPPWYKYTGSFSPPPWLSGGGMGTEAPTGTPATAQQPSPWLNAMTAARDASYTYNPASSGIGFGAGPSMAGPGGQMPYNKAFANYAANQQNPYSYYGTPPKSTKQTQFWG